MVFRWIFGLPGAALVTALLFLAMAFMVKQEATTTPPKPPVDFSILAKRKIDPPTKVHIDKPAPVDAPEAIEIKTPDKMGRPTGVPTGKLPTPTLGDTGTRGLPTLPTPAFKTRPVYPQACLARGAQGVVLVEFDVTPEGAVVNPRIISTPDSCFNRTVLREIQRWKYPPETNDGRAVMQRGVRAAINFQLEG